MSYPYHGIGPRFLRALVVLLLVLHGRAPLQVRARADTRDWTWTHDTDTAGEAGTYGVLGSPHPDNRPGGRQKSATWVDADGPLWLFGGWGRGSSGFNGALNDLWRYDVSSGQWVWVGGSDLITRPGVYGTKGTPHADNWPGSRHAGAAWRDGDGNLWLFGGYGYDANGANGALNDLWRYNVGTGQWTWISGSNSRNQPGTYGTKGVAAAANVPGGRQQSITWLDADGGLWLFGGMGRDSVADLGPMNDLWRYHIASGQWTWMSGGNVINRPGVYGTKGVQDAANVPGARWRSISWVDSSGRLWLMGGNGRDKDTNTGLLNDLWRYDPAVNLWAWLSGSNVHGQHAVFGTLGEPDGDNVPGGREHSVSWVDAEDGLWLLGGVALGSAGSQANMNDLWRYDIASGLWSWVGGANVAGQTGVYGTRGVGSPDNMPGARQQSVVWTDDAGRFWLFGGSGIDGNGDSGYLNDLWQYAVPVRIVAVLADEAASWDIRWIGIPGVNYVLQETTDLETGVFEDVGDALTCLEGTNSVLRTTVEPAVCWRLREGP